MDLYMCMLMPNTKSSIQSDTFIFLDTSQASADVSLMTRSLISAVVVDEGVCVCVCVRERVCVRAQCEFDASWTRRSLTSVVVVDEGVYVCL